MKLQEKNSNVWLCLDCQVDTSHKGIREYYMVHNHVWREAFKTEFHKKREPGMLCLGCLETRLGRMLTAFDFTSCALHEPEVAVWSSERMQHRITHIPEYQCLANDAKIGSTSS